jgi:hypothetical protein
MPAPLISVRGAGISIFNSLGRHQRGARGPYFIPATATSKTSVAWGGISPLGVPCAP